MFRTGLGSDQGIDVGIGSMEVAFEGDSQRLIGSRVIL
jgi:hypothetical protein